jgi:hypothetical protein
MRITDYSREQIQQFVRDGICTFQTLRDYDLLKQIQNGEKITHAAMDNNISREQAWRIRKKYTPRG